MRRAMQWIPWGVVAASLLCGLPAWGKQPALVVTDLFGDPDVRDEAAALSLVIQSALDSVAVPRRRLAAAVTKVSGRSARYALVVEAGKRAELRKELGADILLWGTVQRKGTQLSAALHASRGGDGQLVGSASLNAGRLVELGFDLARRAAKALDLPTPSQVSTVGYGQLYPYVLAAKAHLGGRHTRAASALAIADAQAAQSLSALREVALEGADAVTLGLEDRVLCALAAADGKRALDLARRMASTAGDRPSRDMARAASPWHTWRVAI